MSKPGATTAARQFTIAQLSKQVKLSYPTGGCWEWQGYIHPSGYGSLWSNPVKRSVKAHRFMYELLVKADIGDKVIDHLCRNTICVNPRHLEPVTDRENVLRGEGITAQQAKQTACKNGHPFNQENTYTAPGKKWRDCKKCRYQAHIRWVNKKRSIA